MERSIEGLEFRLSWSGYQATGGLLVEFHEDDTAAPNWARLSLPDDLQDKFKGIDIGVCTLDIGSDGDYETLLEGNGNVPQNVEGILIIKDGLENLRRVKICNTFLNCHPQEAVRYILTVAGIEEYHLNDTEMGIRKVFTINNMNALEALKEINVIYGIDVSFGFWEGAFWWGIEPDQEEIVTITDDNTMKLQRLGSLWEAEILTIPWIKTGQMISVDCEEYTGLGTVTKRILKSNGTQIDMYINFREAEAETDE